MKKLSIIIPVYNERATIAEIIKRLETVDFSPNEKELIIVDDGSCDGTRDILDKEISYKHKVIYHQNNQGKGSAIRTGLQNATGNFFVIQDADLEYEPRDLSDMLSFLQEEDGRDVVYGSRTLDKKNKPYSSYLFHLGGLFVTWWTNFLYGAKLTDEATCYKMFTKRALNSIALACRGFEFCPELTGKLLKAGFLIHEVPISYNPRSRREGKKIKISDGLIALWTLFCIRIF